MENTSLWNKMPTPVFIDYKLARSSGPGPITAIKYEYVLAGNGLFIRARRREFSVCLPLHAIAIEGLKPISAYIAWHGAPVRREIWQAILENARAGSDSGRFKEDVFIIYRDQLGSPWQWKNVSRERSAVSTTADDSLVEYAHACIELHTHPPGAYHFSGQDDRDESGKFRLFAILIDIHTPHPKIRFRCGVYEYFVEIPAGFVAEMPAGFVDLNYLEQLIEDKRS